MWQNKPDHSAGCSEGKEFNHKLSMSTAKANVRVGVGVLVRDPQDRKKVSEFLYTYVSELCVIAKDTLSSLYSVNACGVYRYLLVCDETPMVTEHWHYLVVIWKCTKLGKRYVYLLSPF